MSFQPCHKMPNLMKKIQIKDINLDCQYNFFLTCLIIQKSEFRLFKNKRQSANDLGDGEDNGVVSFTFRDTKRDLINCTVWGSRQFIEKYNRLFSIGDVVNIISPRVTLVNSEDQYQQYKPLTSSLFNLIINENTNEITPYDGSNRDALKALLNIPTKPVDRLLTLLDIKTSHSSETAHHCDLMVIVRLIKDVRQIAIRRGGVKQCREIIVMDESLSGMSLTIWNGDYINRSDNWISLTTTLFLSDIRIEFSKFYKTVVLTVSNRTILFENPNVKRAKDLKAFVDSSPLQPMENIMSPNDVPELHTITNVMSIRKINDLNKTPHDTEEQFTALCYAIVSRFDIDGFTRICSKRCIRCHCLLKHNLDYCDRESCLDLQLNSNQSEIFTKIFDISMDITDHTGTLTNCRLTDKQAEKVLGYSLEEFQNLNDERKEIIKWTYLLERCAIKLLIRRKTVYRSRTFISILDLVVPDSDEIVAKIKVY